MHVSWLPASQWLKSYSTSQFISDLVAAVIVTIMLIPSRLPMPYWRACPPRWVCMPAFYR